MDGRRWMNKERERRMTIEGEFFLLEILMLCMHSLGSSRGLSPLFPTPFMGLW